MNPKPWNTPKVALAGALIGAILAFVNIYQDLGTADPFHLEGQVAGQALAMAAMFAAVSAIRNWDAAATTALTGVSS